ncbi:DUF294 nucleotidyltransferase-like domain-containing protein [Paenibacillus sp. N1-5-1-14]|uniref:DUF294 nucleotidyltransferase-like domain-containing protein n=1 Tax=Paenibacillus radicibacter TaxID=2972488 RepID=UPI00215943C5|nr:DUF294 nucleotidyltransferase-like domain-containing protein [Paenibacillus radicibacter]MCR8642629.1 DUF294 nucleotidyltransferase-like domain-containing protein [Paenibacillus radicibacter]
MEAAFIEKLQKKIADAVTMRKLREIRDSITSLFMLEEVSGQGDILERYARFNVLQDCLIARVVQLVESDLSSGGRVAPCAYAFVLFGSGGRREQTYVSDQDNGIIYADQPIEKIFQAHHYFRMLGEAVQHALEEIGYPPCAGRVVCGNTAWRGSVRDWNEQLYKWGTEPTWEHIRYLLVMADMRMVYGSADVVEHVAESFRQLMHTRPELVQEMLANTLFHRPITGVFGNLVPIPYGEYAGGIEIKYGLYIPFVNAIRLLSLIHGVQAVSTIERMKQLADRQVLAVIGMQMFYRGLADTLSLRSCSEAGQIEGMVQSGGIIEKELITKEIRLRIKNSIRVVKRMQRLVHQECRSWNLRMRVR